MNMSTAATAAASAPVGNGATRGNPGSPVQRPIALQTGLGGRDGFRELAEQHLASVALLTGGSRAEARANSGAILSPLVSPLGTLALRYY